MPAPRKLTDEQLIALVEKIYKESGEVPKPGRVIYTARRVFQAEPSRVRATKAVNAFIAAKQIVVAEHEREEVGVELPPPRANVADDYPQVMVPALVVSDFHIPAQDVEWIEAVTRYAHNRGVGRVIVAGDLLDFHHLSRFPKERRWTTEEELEDAARLIRWLKKQFDNVHIFPGNHDVRLSRRVDGEITVLTLLKWVADYEASKNISVYRHHQVMLGHTWVVAHPRNYSRVPVRPADQLALKLGKNVAIAHTHKIGMARVNGYWAVEIGIMADPGRLAYTHIELNTFPQMEQGALIIDEEERPNLLHPGLL